MERQVIIHLAGGIAEAIYRGECRKAHVLDFASEHCAMYTDLARAAAVMDYDETDGGQYTGAAVAALARRDLAGVGLGHQQAGTGAMGGVVDYSAMPD